jgi:hypothetical protein
MHPNLVDYQSKERQVCENAKLSTENIANLKTNGNSWIAAFRNVKVELYQIKDLGS